MAENKNKALIERVNSSYATFREKVEAYEKALAENDFTAISQAEALLKEAEKDYQAQKTILVFAELRDTENPIQSAIERLDFQVVRHKVEKDSDTGRIIGVNEDTKTVQIDLVKFCKFCKLPTDWKFAVQKFTKLLVLRAAIELKLTKAQIKVIDDSFAMDKLADKVELGETPTSNTQICKQLQAVVDRILFIDDGKGKNKIKVNNHDVSYLLMCFSKRGRSSLRVQTINPSANIHLIMDIMHRILTGKVYDVDYKMKKAEDRGEKPVDEPKEIKKAAKK